MELDQQCKLVYDEVQKGKKHKYFILKIDDSVGKIVVDKIGDNDKTYDQFLDDICVKDGEADDCRYAVIDFEFKAKTQGTEAMARNKLILIAWCPDSARVKKKMIYASSFDTLKKAFTGVHKIIQANDLDEIVKENVENELQQAARV